MKHAADQPAFDVPSEAFAFLSDRYETVPTRFPWHHRFPPGFELGDASVPLKGAATLSVAILEDDPAVRFAATFFCEGLGMEVVAGETGRELAGMIASRGVQPALIIADYRLGARTAVEELADVIGAVPTTTKVIVATGDTSSDARDRIEACGWQRLIKPYRPDELVSVINGLSARAENLPAADGLVADGLAEGRRKG